MRNPYLPFSYPKRNGISLLPYVILCVEVIIVPHSERKPNRLVHYDYRMPNAYFITICTQKRQNLFWAPVGASIARPQNVPLSAYGKIVDAAIRDIPKHYPAVTLDHYVVMPNHIHLLLQIHSDAQGRPMVAPTVSTIIQQMKGIVTKQIGISIWQKLFYDHVIRCSQDYEMVWNYIEANPAKWREDCFYPK